LEALPRLGTGVTARNGAQLSYAYCDPMGTPSIARDLPRLMTGLDPAFRIRPSLNPRFLSWALQLLANCSEARSAANLRAVLRLALRSRAALLELQGSHPGLSFSHAASGKLLIYDSVKKFTAARAAVHIKNEMGCGQRILRKDEVVALEPALSACQRDIVGAIYSPIDEAGDAAAFTQALAEIAVRQHGLVVLQDTRADGFVVEGRHIRAVRTRSGYIEGDRFVLATGGGAVWLAASVGLKLPIYPMKGYSVTLPATALTPAVSITDTRAKIVFCRLQDQVRIAGLAELGRADDAIDPRRVTTLLQMARDSLPAAAEWGADAAAWAGLRPMTPDSRPIIGATRLENLFLNCGHGMLGWTLACGSAELLASLMLDERPAGELRTMATDFGITRFSRNGATTRDEARPYAGTRAPT
jgi:D-amino-acid dehydrogenase